LTEQNEDFLLIQRYQQDDRTAFKELFQKYYPQVYRIIILKGIPAVEAEDLTSEIFIKLIPSLKKYRMEKPFEHFLHRVVRNHLLDYFRKYKSDSYNFYIYESFESNSAAEFIELEEIVENCLEKIKNLTRRAIILLWIEGYKRHQIAETLKLPIGSVHSSLERGKADLRKCVKEKLK
jgi:RNA polymerase sigma-70 factor (ECF subfamily)